MRRSLCNTQRRENVWWVGLARSALWIFRGNIFDDSCTEEGLGAGEAIFEVGFKFAAYETRK